MTEVSIKWRQGQSKEAIRALEMSTWLTTQGLVLRQDYVWKFDIENRITTFKFEKNFPVITMFAIRWT